MPLKGTDNPLVGVIYRSQLGVLRPDLESNDTSLMDLLKQAQSLSATLTLITGDFYFPNIDWSH